MANKDYLHIIPEGAPRRIDDKTFYMLYEMQQQIDLLHEKVGFLRESVLKLEKNNKKFINPDKI